MKKDIVFPKNFNRDEIAEIVFNAIPKEADPKEILNGLLSETTRFIACATKDVPTTEEAIFNLFKTYLKMHREEIKNRRYHNE